MAVWSLAELACTLQAPKNLIPLTGIDVGCGASAWAHGLLASGMLWVRKSILAHVYVSWCSRTCDLACGLQPVLGKTLVILLCSHLLLQYSGVDAEKHMAAHQYIF